MTRFARDAASVEDHKWMDLAFKRHCISQKPLVGWIEMEFAPREWKDGRLVCISIDGEVQKNVCFQNGYWGRYFYDHGFQEYFFQRFDTEPTHVICLQ